MSKTVTVRLPMPLANRLRALSQNTRRPTAHYIREALEHQIGRMEWEQRILQNVEDARAGRRPTISLAEAKRRLDLDD